MVWREHGATALEFATRLLGEGTRSSFERLTGRTRCAESEGGGTEVHRTTRRYEIGGLYDLTA